MSPTICKAIRDTRGCGTDLPIRSPQKNVLIRSRGSSEKRPSTRGEHAMGLTVQNAAGFDWVLWRGIERFL